MANRSVRITLTVDSKGAVKAVGATEDEMMDLRKTVEKMDKDLLGLERSFQAGLIDASESAQGEVQVLEKALKRMTAQGVDPASEGFQRYKRRLEEMKLGLEGTAAQTAPRATNALMNLNHVVSDAPYGFMAIANNIDPLVASFQRLQRDAGGTTGAFRALFSSLAGPAGVAFAVSALSSAIISYGPQILEFLSSTGKEAKEMREGIEEAIDGLLTLETGITGFVITPEGIEAALGALDDVERKIHEQINALRLAEQQGGGLGEALQKELQHLQAQIPAIDGLREDLEKMTTEAEIQAVVADVLTRAGIERAEAAKATREEEEKITQALSEQQVDLSGIGRPSEFQREAEALRDLARANDEVAYSIREQAAARAKAALQAEKLAVRELAAERQKQAAKERTIQLTAEAAFMQAKSAEDVISATRNVVKAIIAEAVATQILNALKTIPFPFNVIVATAAGAAAGALFEQVVPSFRVGVSDFGGGLAQVHKDEIIALPGGSSVVSQFDSRAIMAGARAGASSGANRLEAAALRFERTVKALQSQGIPARFDRTVHNTAVRESAYHSELTTTSR